MFKYAAKFFKLLAIAVKSEADHILTLFIVCQLCVGCTLLVQVNHSLRYRYTISITMWRKRRSKIDDDERVIKDIDKARERTMNRAVKLLAAKPRSIGELRERLLEKSWTSREIVDGVIEKLADYKYVDDK